MRDGRSAIKQGQIDILETLYKYRFGSRELIAKALDVNSVTLHKKLAVLIKHGLVVSRLNGKSKLHGKPVAYFLSPNGLRFLQSLPNHSYITDSILRGSYRDKSLAETFIDHTLAVFAAILTLKTMHPSLKAYLRRDMSRFSYFPETPPDAFLSLTAESGTRRFFLHIISNHQEQQTIFRRISVYLTYFDEGGWDVTDAEVPLQLVVCADARNERKVRRTIKAALNGTDMDNPPDFYTTTQVALTCVDDAALIWTPIDDDEPLSLVDICE